jgi:putative hydrolase of the HAD superfamily
MPAIRGLLLDLDDTLFDHRHATRRAFAAWHACSGAGDGGETGEQALARWLAISNKHWRRLAEGEISFLELRRDRLRDFFGRSLADAEADALFEPYRQAYEQNWMLTAQAEAFLLATDHLPRVVVTNGPRAMQQRKLAVTGLSLRIQHLVTPEDCGHAKPRPEIFLHALERLGLQASECLMVSDDHRCDIAPAQALGMAAFHVDHEGRGLTDALVLLRPQPGPA